MDSLFQFLNAILKISDLWPLGNESQSNASSSLIQTLFVGGIILPDPAYLYNLIWDKLGSQIKWIIIDNPQKINIFSYLQNLRIELFSST